LDKQAQRMHRIVAIVVSLAVIAAVTWRFPLFHVVRLEDRQSQGKFDAATLVQKSWREKLPAALDKATDAAEVLTALQADFTQASKQYGRTVGMGRAFFLLLRGSGKITSVDKDGVSVTLDAAKDQLQIVIPTGPLFGNAVRNATGMFDTNDFSNSEQFNAISTELNRRVETQIVPELKAQAVVGKHIQFIGCAEVRDRLDEHHPLEIVPLEVKVDAKTD
jgi:predicted lipoprotein